jgi:hypothetical protein
MKPKMSEIADELPGYLLARFESASSHLDKMQVLTFEEDRLEYEELDSIARRRKRDAIRLRTLRMKLKPLRRTLESMAPGL